MSTNSSDYSTTTSSNYSIHMSATEKLRAMTRQKWCDLGSSYPSQVCGAPRSRDEIVERVCYMLFLRLAALLAIRNDDCRTAVFRTEDVNLDLLDDLLPVETQRQLHDYVQTIMGTYKDDVHYHSVDHAYHVILSSHKLLDMLLTPPSSADATKRTFGIRSNPMLQLALIFAAMIHDADHQGVTNAQLVLEGDSLAMTYNDQSVAEQHSLSISFRELNKPKYSDLYKAMFRSPVEYHFFRKLVIELVLCTDIASPERTQIVKSKWKEAFGGNNQKYPYKEATTGSTEDDDNVRHNSPDYSPPSSCSSSAEEEEPAVVTRETENRGSTTFFPTRTIRIRDQMRLSAISALSMDARAVLEEEEKEPFIPQQVMKKNKLSQRNHLRRLSVISALSMDAKSVLEEKEEEQRDEYGLGNVHLEEKEEESFQLPHETATSKQKEGKDKHEHHIVLDANIKEFEEDTNAIIPKHNREESEETNTDEVKGIHEEYRRNSFYRSTMYSTESRHNYDLFLPPPIPSMESIPKSSSSTNHNDVETGSLSTMTSHLKLRLRRSLPYSNSTATRSHQLRLGVRQAIDFTGLSVVSYAKGASPMSLHCFRCSPSHNISLRHSNNGSGNDLHRQTSSSSSSSSSAIKLQKRLSPQEQQQTVPPYHHHFDDEPDDFRACVVLETLLKVADISSNMQSWDRYKLWSSRLFFEQMYTHEIGRNPGPDPRNGWFDLQITFIDSYVVPLANRLHESGVFGHQDGVVFLRHVQEIRRKWLMEGRDFTEWLANKWASMRKQKHDDNDDGSGKSTARGLQ